MIPPLRVIPPSTAQLHADGDAPFVVYFGDDHETLTLATSACGLGIAREGAVSRVPASRSQLEQLAGELERRGGVSGKSLRRYLEPVRAWRLRTRELTLDQPRIMGILNITEDSFSGDGIGGDPSRAVERAGALREEGADIIDVGAESARADRPIMDAAVEAVTMSGVVKALAAEGHLVSVDTYKGEVARAALDAGAEIVNDISGLTAGRGAAEEAAAAGAGYVLNYSYSVPKRRPDTPPVYRDVVTETVAWMFERVEQLQRCGLPDEQIAVDPGIAFGKSHDEDLQVLRRIGEMCSLGLPVLLAHSRKNFIGSVGDRAPSDRDLETHVASALAFAQGVRIFRVHDVGGTRRALELARALTVARTGEFGPDGESWPWRAGAAGSHVSAAPPDREAPKGQRW